MSTRLIILGSTGSIGRSALEVVDCMPGTFDVMGLGAHSNAELLIAQAKKYNPKWVAVFDDRAAEAIANALPDLEILHGHDGVVALASKKVDVVLCGIVGAAGLDTVISAIDAGNRIALANKEPMVMAGSLIRERAQSRGVEILPVDSEHNAIFQCLAGQDIADVHRVHLTASGGPFYGAKRESLSQVTPEQASSHPNWDMGAKISVDSATLMNKGLEVIEAMWLFGLNLDQIEVVIHPQSTVHSLVEFTDGSLLAHLGVTDMKLPIQFALTWPKRVRSAIARLDLTTMNDLSFAKPDFTQFPCLELALNAAKRGGTAPAVLNAANEFAVDAFLNYKLGFLQISELVENVLTSASLIDDPDLDAVKTADADARIAAKQIAAEMKTIAT